MPAAELQWFATLGVGGVIAAFMFLIYRKDVGQYLTILKNESENNRKVLDQVLTVVLDNTRALTKVESAVDSMHRRLDANHDSKNTFPQREPR